MRDISEMDRALWSAVVLQAIADVESESLGSVEYAQAAGFLTGGGAWRESRVAIADMLHLHADDIKRIGQRRIAARQAEKGMVSEATIEPASPSSPTLTVVMYGRSGYDRHLSGSNLLLANRSIPMTPQRRKIGWRTASGINPFNPHQRSAYSD